MLTFKPLTTTDAVLYQYMEELLTKSFPKEEYRDLNELSTYTDKNPMFKNNIILDGNSPIGLLTYWNLDNFIYVEHFAIDPKMRSGGYGRKALEELCKLSELPIILEVEIPETEDAKRRIGFYERFGYKLWTNEYKQPPYREEDDFLPMHLMAFGDVDDNNFNAIKTAIYKNVYGYC